MVQLLPVATAAVVYVAKGSPVTVNANFGAIGLLAVLGIVCIILGVVFSDGVGRKISAVLATLGGLLLAVIGPGEALYNGLAKAFGTANPGPSVHLTSSAVLVGVAAAALMGLPFFLLHGVKTKVAILLAILGGVLLSASGPASLIYGFILS